MTPRIMKIPFYPFLFALFPIVSLLSTNLDEIHPDEVVRTMIVILACVVLLFLLLRQVLNSTEKAAIYSSLLVVAFLSYGHLYHLLRDELPNGLLIFRHRYLVIVFGIGLLTILFGLVRSKRDIQVTTPALNFISIGLLVLPIFIISESIIQSAKARTDLTEQRGTGCNPSLQIHQSSPDIYYIILDGYVRQDVLMETYDYDNELFLKSLEEVGFYIADGSQSNYAHTIISLSSSLDMVYHELIDSDGVAIDPKEYRISGIGHPQVRRELECLGYTSVALDSGTDWSNWRDADIFMTSKESGAKKLLLLNANEFESMVAYNSAGLIALDASAILSSKLRAIIDYPYTEHQENVLFALDELGTSVPKLSSPKLIYAHIISPHRPYFFDAEGGFIEPSSQFTLRDLGDLDIASKREGYRNQVAGINEKVLEMVRGIQENSETPPIIIIHADHGTGDTFEELMPILMAMNLPEDGSMYLYETISPVNIFRVIFNTYFNGEYEILEDTSFYSHWDTRFDFIEIPNTYTDN